MSDTEDRVIERPEVAPTFAVTDEASANWVIRKIIECRAYARRCAEWCERECARAEHDEPFFLMHFGAQLREFLQTRLADQGHRRRSVGLPAGTIGFRKEASRLVIDDEDAVRAWARAHHPELLVMTERLSKSAMDELVQRTGEVPESGVHIQPEHDKFYVQ